MHKITVEVRVEDGENSRWNEQDPIMRGGEFAGAFAWNQQVTAARRDRSQSVRVTLWRQKPDGEWKSVETWEQTGWTS